MEVISWIKGKGEGNKIEVSKDSGGPAEDFAKDCNLLEFPQGFSRVGPTGYRVPTHRVATFSEILDFEVRSDDVWINGFPKSGTTWVQELVWLLLNDLDFDGARAVPSHLRVPFIGTYKNLPEPSTLDYFDKMRSPRCIKSHLPYSLLPTGFRSWVQVERSDLESCSGPKLIMVIRDPRDVCVSYFHHCVAYQGYRGTLEGFCEAFLDDSVRHAPYWAFVNSYWPHRAHPRILILTYEEMTQNLKGSILKVAKFLEKPKPDPAQVKSLEEYLSFGSMRANPSVNLETAKSFYTERFGRPVTFDFIRKGKVGGWREELSPELGQRFQDWIQKNQLSWNEDDLDCP